MPIGGLDDPCGTCGKRSGSHTLDDWAACMAAFETEEYGAGDAAGAVRDKFGGIDADTLIADHVLVEAATLDGTAGGGTSLAIPALIHNFAIGEDGDVKPVARVLFLAEPKGMAEYAGLIADATAGANAKALG